ncbi:hypothetical protein [Roseimaritima ulvae]|uniref:hypothetical protein n=1 Tax=Roseimaritima ulvae TaxID=980254 RepID=UPI0011CD62B9|nr:hypothetical protein [Roseimaritima ulvae]
MSDDMEDATAAVMARCESVSAEEDGFSFCRMQVTDVVKGDPRLANSVLEVSVLGDVSPGGVFWLVGYGETSLQWASPEEVSAQAVSYFRGLTRLPDAGPRRLEYFLKFLRHGDPFVATDAYNEFAEASLADIAELRDQLDRQWIVDQILDPTIPVHRRRLCWTFLSQCGTAADAGLLDVSLRHRTADADFDPGMDAAIACCISLGGETALSRIEQKYMANPDAPYSDSFAAINAIRVHGTELDVVPRQRLSASLRHVLSRPKLADVVIPDLARWKDWSAIERIAELFATSTEDNRIVQPAAVLYLKTCPLPAAAEALERLRALDPKTVQAAESSMMFYRGLPAVPVPPPVQGS